MKHLPWERRQKAKAVGFFLMGILTFVGAAFLGANGTATPEAARWAKTLNGVVALVLLVGGFCFLYMMRRQARDTSFAQGTGIIAWLTALCSMILFVVSIDGDRIVFMSALLGIGAGLITQVAFHYFVDPVGQATKSPWMAYRGYRRAWKPPRIRKRHP